MTDACELNVAAEDIIKAYQLVAEELRGAEFEHDFTAILFREASNEENSKNIREGCNGLAHAMNLYLDANDVDNPLKSMYVGSESRTICSDDFNENTLAAFDLAIDAIDNLMIQARLIDLLWVRKTHQKFGVRAVDIYMEIVNNKVDEESHFSRFSFLKRAAVIARSLGRRTKSFSLVHGFCLSEIMKWDNGLGDHKNIFDLIEVLNELKSAEHELMSRCLQKAGEAVIRSDPTSSADYFELAYDLTAKCGDADLQMGALTAFVDACLESGRVVGSIPGNAMATSYWIERAVHKVTKYGKAPELREKLLTKLAEAQAKGIESMSRLSVSVDLGPELVQYIEAINSDDLRVGLNRILELLYFEEKDNLKNRTLEYLSKSLIPSIFGGTQVANDGSTVKKFAPLKLGSEMPESDLQDHMWNLRSKSLAVMTSCIEWGRIRLMDGDPEVQGLVDEIVFNSPLVPEDRKRIWIIGFTSALSGNYLVALHLLIPQFEHSLREVLRVSGDVTNRLKPNGEQEQHMLGRLLDDSTIKQYLGTDLAFELKGLFTEKSGSNLRHELAHGLIPDTGFLQPATIYGTWLILKIMCQTQTTVKDAETSVDEEA